MEWVKPKTYQNPIYPYQRSTDQDANQPKHHQVVIVGAGPVGLCAALDLASRGIPSVVLSNRNTVTVGSRAICFAKKTLEIINRISRTAFDRMIKKGVIWNVGKVFYKDEKVYEFNLLPEESHKVPAFINLQQYYFEEYLVDEVHANKLIDIRWENELINHIQQDENVTLTIQTPEDEYQISTDYLLACDGVHSPIRKRMGLAFEGEAFEENFLIADIVMENDFPTERWFWFDPPFNEGYSALLHKQPDGVWRIDIQLGNDIDPEKELEPNRIKSRLRKMLGEDVKFELEWTSIYRFRCMRIEKFVHGRVIFAGDAAHLVSPFGARGANGGVQDADNLIWKLAAVLNREAPSSLLETYDEERSPATDENIFHSSNATDFITPKSEVSIQFRNAVLELAQQQAFAQKMVNSGRLSHAYRYINSPLVSPLEEEAYYKMQPGFSVKDCILHKKGEPIYLIDELGNDFTLILFGNFDFKEKPNLKVINIGSDLEDKDGLFAQRYEIEEGTWLLIRPDHYIAARGKVFNEAIILSALKQSIKKPTLNNTDPSDVLDKYGKDENYRLLITAHEGKTKTESEHFNIKLLLSLMQHIESPKVFEQLILNLEKK